MAQTLQRSASTLIAGLPHPKRVREKDRNPINTSRRGFSQLLSGPKKPGRSALLPDKSDGDLFLDLEGDAFVAGEGLEYLFGLLELEIVDETFGSKDVSPERYVPFWATNRAEERVAFEKMIDAIAKRRKDYPALHVYHFGHRENTALKKLASRHGTRIDEVDDLLRNEVLVDLHRITRQAIRASVESYSLKQLEGLQNYNFKRTTPVREASAAMQQFGWWLETGEARQSPAELRSKIERYNEEDCRSTRALRDWLLEEQRTLLKERKAAFPKKNDEASRKPSDKRALERAEARAKARAETARLMERLRSNLSSDPSLDTPEQSAKRLLAHILEWHRRELNPAYWEYFRTRDLPEDDRIEDRAVIGSMRHVTSTPDPKSNRSSIHVYEFPAQEHGIKLGDEPDDPITRKGVGTVVDIGTDYVHLKRAKTSKVEHPRALIPAAPLETERQEESLRRIATSIVERGLDVAEPYGSARKLLLRHSPTPIAEGASLVQSDEDVTAALCRITPSLNRSFLAVQGPPGSGKTTAAAKMIVDLIRSGSRVGVAAHSHQVILNLLRAVVERAKVRCLHMGEEKNLDAPVPFELNKEYATIASRLDARELDLVGGTSWAWSRTELCEKVDVLIIDEAGQISLANALAMSQAAKNLVLLGDPNQLEQPTKGVHPEGSEGSALDHILGDAVTMPPHLGLFMPHTWRLHPDICAFTSSIFYESRLQANAALARQRVIGAGQLSGSGLRFIPVEHQGNTNHSPEEIECIVALVGDLFAGSPKFIDKNGGERVLDKKDVLIVAPYNVQVAELKKRLPDHPIGTVDKFQGKEAPLVIYSMATSSAEDAPRGLEFLFSLNRLNVATSRAQALVVVVANPELGRARCRSPRQMKLANAFCAYLESAATRVP